MCVSTILSQKRSTTFHYPLPLFLPTSFLHVIHQPYYQYHARLARIPPSFLHTIRQRYYRYHARLSCALHKQNVSPAPTMSQHIINVCTAIFTPNGPQFLGESGEEFVERTPIVSHPPLSPITLPPFSLNTAAYRKPLLEGRGTHLHPTFLSLFTLPSFR